MAYLLALCAIAFWSTNAVTAKFVLQGLPVEQIQFLQFLGATCVFAFLRYGSTAKGKQNRIGMTAWILGTVGLTGTMIFQYIGFDIGPITEANIIAYAWPLFAVFFVVLSGTTPRPILLLTLAVIGFLGAGLVIGGNEWSNLSFATSPYGFMAAALSAVCMAVYTFGIGQTKTNANDVLLPGALVGLVITAVWCVTGSSVWSSPSLLALGFYLGAGPMGLGYLFWSWAMQKDPSGNTALLGYLTPITSTSLLFTSGERLDTSSLVGAAVVIACCTLISLQPRQEKHA